MSRVAIVHDWLTGQRGGEHVLEAILALLPTADLFCVTHVPGSVSRAIEERRPRTSFLARVPLLRSRPFLALPLLPRAIESLDLAEYDAVLSISHCVAVGARARGVHLVYSLSPMRYAWDAYDEYEKALREELGRVPALVTSTAAPVARRRLQAWDRRAGERPEAIAAISEHVRARVREAYRRDARVVYPPVDTEAFAREEPKGDRFIAVGAVRPNKRLFEIAEAFRALALPLDIVGPGRPSVLERLRRAGGPTVTVHGEVPRDQLVRLVGRARALVHAANEDFGIAPVEALAAGRPVIAFARSGVRESIAPPEVAPAGVLFEDATPGGIARAVREFIARERDLPPPLELRARARVFSIERFRATFTAFLLEEGGEAFARALAPGTEARLAPGE